MKIYKLTIQPESPFITPLQSDTIFGHLAWAIVYSEGEQRLKEILDEFNSANPPFIISAAFPKGMLPLPILPSLTQKEVEALAIEYYGDTSTKSRRLLLENMKETNKINYLNIDTFRDLVQDLSPLKLVKALLAIVKSPYPKHSVKETVMHTAIDRITGTAKEGALFDHEETFYNTDAKLTIWLRLRDDSWKNDLYQWFKVIETSGFGKRKSTGLGQFQIIGDITEAQDELPQVTNPNGFVSLSSYVPNLNDPIRGYYRYIVKRGKLGGHWALDGRVWKKPLLMLLPGSVFYTEEKPWDYHGSLIPEIHQDNPKIVQYAFAFPIGLRLPGYKEFR